MKQFIVVLFFSLTLLLPTHTRASENWQITNFSSDITLEENGKVLVDEMIAVDFGSQQKHGIYRDLPIQYAKQDGGTHYTELSLQSVTLDGKAVPVKQSDNGANLRLQIGDPNHTISGKHTYRVQYEITGVLSSYDAYDEFYWNVTGTDWPVPIKNATATVHFPEQKGNFLQASCYQGSMGSTERCSQTLKTNIADFNSTHPFLTGEGLTIAVGYPKHSLPILTITPPPSPFTPAFFGLLLGGFLISNFVGGILLYRRWWQTGRDAQHHLDSSRHDFPVRQTIVAEYEPPAKLRPAEIGTLVDERADTTDVTATIIDLAVRGYLTITEEPKKWLRGADYTLTKKKSADKALLEYEKTLLQRLFSKDDSIRTSQLQNTFYQDLATIKEEVYDEVTAKKLFISNPQQTRNNWVIIGIILLVVGIGGCVSFSALVGSTANLLAAALIGISAGLVLIGLATLISSYAMPARTAYGRELYRQAKGYELFINTAEKYRAQFAEKENLFTEVLPYAIVFGATKKLSDAMKKMGITPPAPAWYYGPHPFNPVFFANSMANFDKSLSTAMTSTPSGSGSGGGGFSGGGFGGGGGGSW